MLRANRNKGIATTPSSSSSPPTILPMFQSSKHQHHHKMKMGNDKNNRRGAFGKSGRRVKGGGLHIGGINIGSSLIRKRVALLGLAILTFVLVFLSTRAQRQSSTTLSSSAPVAHWFAPPFQNRTDYDLICLGAGPAGLSSALFGARAGLRVLVLGYSTGGASGSLAEASGLQNFPGFVLPSSSSSSAPPKGQDWLQTTQQQASSVGVQFAQGGLLASHIQVHHHHDSTNSLLPRGTQVAPFFSVHVTAPTVNYTATARALIVATGAQPKRLELPHERDALWGKFVHSCAICDGSSYRHKTVVVVGGGDAAVEAVLLLSSQPGTRVIWVHRQRTFQRASHVTQLQLALSRAVDEEDIDSETKNKVVELKTPYVIQSYTVEKLPQIETASTSKGKDSQQHEPRITLTGVALKHVETSKIEQITCDGVFVMIGSVPTTAFVKDVVELDDTTGLIKLFPNGDGVAANRNQVTAATATSIPGIFAAGEVTDHLYKQAITAAAAGAQAALDAERWLRVQEEAPAAIQQSEAHEFANELISQSTANIPLQNFERTTTHHRKDQVIDSSSKTDRTATEQRKEPSTTSASRQDTEDCHLSKQDCLRKYVKRWHVVVFTKPWCPYCKRALEALALEGLQEGPSLHVVDLTDARYESKMSEIQDALLEWTGRRTVPNVFLGGKSIGGGDETLALHREGKLKELLRELKAPR